MAEIKVKYSSLAKQVRELTKLEGETGYSIYCTSSLINQSSGSMTDAANQVYQQLMEIEEIFRDIVSQTKTVLKDAGISFLKDELTAQDMYEQVKESAR